MGYYLGSWHLLDGGYVPPPGTSALLNLSPAESPGSVGLFAGDNPGLDYEGIADHRLEEYAWNALTLGAGPVGFEAPGPLVPTTRGDLELVLGPMGLVRREKFVWGKHSHTNRLRDRLREVFRRHWDRDRDHARRCLDYECAKYRLGGEDWRELVPRDLLPHVPGRLPHATTYTDNFNRADQFLNALGTWSDTPGSKLSIVGNRVRSIDFGTFVWGRYDSDLSGSDHFSSVDFVGGSGIIQCGSTARVSGSVVNTCYMGTSRIDNTTATLFSVASGTTTAIASGTGNTSMPFSCVTTCDGSTISYEDGVASLSVTDTAIAGNVRGGLVILDVGTTPELDNWTAEDLGAPPAGTGKPVFRRPWRFFRRKN